MDVNGKNDRQNYFGFSSTIRGRLIMGFSLTLLIFVIAIVINLIQQNRTETFTQQMMQSNKKIETLFRISNQFRTANANLNIFVLTNDKELLKEFKQSLTNVHQLIKTVDDNTTFWPNSKTTNEWNELKLVLSKLENVQSNITTLMATGSTQNAIKQLHGDSVPLVNAVLTKLAGAIDASGFRNGGLLYQLTDQVKSENNDLQTHMQWAIYSQWLLLVIGIVLSLVIVIITARLITVPIYQVIQLFQRIANGERNVTTSQAKLTEITELFQAMDIMQNAIKGNEDKLQHSEEKIRVMLDRIMNDVNYYSEHLNKVANGDLTTRIKESENSELALLGKNLNSMTDGLAKIAKEINQSSQQMVTSLNEVNSAVSSQTSGASEQASAINEITTTLEELETSSTQNLDKVSELGKVAQKTDAESLSGLEVVQQTIDGMSEIRDKVKAIANTILELSNFTQQIGEITSAVSDLAKQSKMLSLNASIEAAKAGEAGKGFSVVAQEVRNLAEQSEQATKQVQKILEDISRATEKAVMATEEGNKGVDIGMKLAEKTGTAMKSLRQVIHDTTMACQHIVAAVRQESVGIKQITSSMDEINQVTTSFVTGVKQTTGAIDNLVDIAKSLKENVDNYRV